MAKKTPAWAIWLIILATVIISIAQVFWKIGAPQLEFDIMKLLTNWGVIVGFLLYGIASALLVKSLKHGELSTLYPFIALSYVWVTFLSYYFFSESINAFKLLGVGVIIIGVSMIGRGEQWQQA